jgi:hypothetical protein
MRFHFFTVEALAPAAGEAELNAFCAQHRIASVDKQFVAHGTHGCWLFCLTTVEGDAAERSSGAARRGRIDYREVLLRDPRPEEAPDPRRVLPRSRSPARDHEPRRTRFRTDTGADELRLPARARGAQGDRAGAGKPAPLSVVRQGRCRRLLPVDRSRPPEATAGPPFQGRRLPRLLGRIIDSCPAAPGRGLPIGSLTSQHFANHYLDGADRFLLDHPLVCAHVRYMDDIIWWGTTARACGRCSPNCASGWRTSDGCA